MKTKEPCLRRSRASCRLCLRRGLHLARKHEPQVVFSVHRQVFDQATPEVLAEVRHLVGQAFQRRDEPLELPPADTGTLTVSDAKEVVVSEDESEEGDESAPDIQPFSKEECYALMRQAAADEFAKGCDLTDLTLEIDFIHIGDTEEYRQYRNLERVFLYDMVRIRHAPTGFVARAQVSGYEWDALARRYNSVTVGNVFAVESSAVAGYQLSEGSVTGTKIAPGSVSGSSLRELSVTNGKIAHI